MLQPWSDIFEYSIAFDPTADLDAQLKDVPAKWVVYLMADAGDAPVQLLCVKNLRYSLKNRLGELEPAAPISKRVNYREIVRRIARRRVDSAFEADAVYLEFARRLFPQTYAGMIGFRPAWFVHVDPNAQFPRYTKTIDLTRTDGTYIGPMEDKGDAQRLIENVEDWFDLCRYYHILVESPRGKACAYKEMGKCPTPCDGSISIEQYRRLIEWSLKTLIDPRAMIREQNARMQTAAQELRFETAAKIKAYIESLSQLGKGAFRHARRLEDFQYLSLQRGPRDGTAKVFLITPGRIDEVSGLISEPERPSELMRIAFEMSHQRQTLDAAGIERIGVVSNHLFQAKATHGVFIPLDQVDEKSITKAYRDLLKQKPVESDDDEGVVKELQAL